MVGRLFAAAPAVVVPDVQIVEGLAFQFNFIVLVGITGIGVFADDDVVLVVEFVAIGIHRL
jgi:hypothetical protein